MIDIEQLKAKGGDKEMNENLTIKEIQSEINDLASAMVDKGVINPRAEVDISQDRVFVWLKGDYVQNPFGGDNMKGFDSFNEAREYIANLLSSEEIITKEYLTRVASAVDYATEHSIADEYVTPLRNVTCAMTDNLLTKENNQ